jgi:hypothetical protein
MTVRGAAVRGSGFVWIPAFAGMTKGGRGGNGLAAARLGLAAAQILTERFGEALLAVFFGLAHGYVARPSA